MLFSWFCYLRRFVFDQSSPVHPVSESRGGTLSVTEKEGRKLLCLILDNVIDYPPYGCRPRPPRLQRGLPSCSSGWSPAPAARPRYCAAAAARRHNTALQRSRARWRSCGRLRGALLVPLFPRWVTAGWPGLQHTVSFPCSRYWPNLFIYQARESSLVPAGFLTVQFLQKT